MIFANFRIPNKTISNFSSPNYSPILKNPIFFSEYGQKLRKYYIRCTWFCQISSSRSFRKEVLIVNKYVKTFCMSVRAVPGYEFCTSGATSRWFSGWRLQFIWVSGRFRGMVLALGIGPYHSHASAQGLCSSGSRLKHPHILHRSYQLIPMIIILIEI